MSGLKIRWFRIAQHWSCWLCGNGATNEVGDLTTPPGWRQTRRGYAGMVTICDECNAKGLKYQREKP